jgi:UDP-GlcNAc:undecaprenyl-phosphate/decaprenyl-phosphate GlcNAc-1-phosphate transferase
VVRIFAWEYLALGLTALVLVGLLTPYARRFAMSHQIYDLPNSTHKSHTEPIPYLGGLAIIIGTIVIAYAALFAREFSAKNLALETSVLGPALLLGMVGLWDDIKNLKPLPRLLVQSIVGIFTAVLLIETHTVGVPTGHAWIDGFITLVWIVGICNSINFFDNVDGGAAGTVAISTIALTYLGYQGGQYFVAALSAVVAGATIGFLLWNKSPARIYMGDAGALFLGVLIATLTIRFHPHALTKWTSFSTKILLLAVPILDTSVSVTSRVLRRISPLQGGQDHLSHRLVRAGLSRKVAVFVLWSLTGAFALCAMVIPSLSKIAEERVVIDAAAIWVLLFFIFLSTRDS